MEMIKDRQCSSLGLVSAGGLCPPRLKGGRGERGSWNWCESCNRGSCDRGTDTDNLDGWQGELEEEKLWPHSSSAFCCPTDASGWLNPTGSLLQSTQASLPGKTPGLERIWRANRKRSSYRYSFLYFEGFRHYPSVSCVVFGEVPCY